MTATCSASTIENRGGGVSRPMQNAASAATKQHFTTMKRSDPTFKQHLLSDLEREEFLDELFSQLFDEAPIDCDTDKVPDFRILTRG